MLERVDRWVDESYIPYAGEMAVGGKGAYVNAPRRPCRGLLRSAPYQRIGRSEPLAEASPEERRVVAEYGGGLGRLAGLKCGPLVSPLGDNEVTPSVLSQKIASFGLQASVSLAAHRYRCRLQALPRELRLPDSQERPGFRGES